MINKNIIVISLVLGGIAAAAQPDKNGELGQFEVKVSERYEAQVKDARRLSPKPNFKDTALSKLPVAYQIDPRPLRVDFQPEPLSPARIARVEVPELYQGMARFGAGLYNSWLAEAYYNSGRSSRRSFGFNGRHFSTQGGVQDLLYDDNAMAQNHLGGYFNRYYRKMTWRTRIEGNWNLVSYYGLPDTSGSPEDAERGQAPYNWFRTYQIETGLHEANSKALGWLKDLSLKYVAFNDNYRSRENDVRLSSQWNLPAGERGLQLELNTSFFNTRYDSLYRGADSSNVYDQGTFQAQIHPYLDWVNGDWQFRFGLDLYLQSQNDDRLTENRNDVYFIPELRALYQIVPGVLNAYAEVDGSLRRNTYRELSQHNTFLLPGQNHLPTREIHAELGLSGKFSSNSEFKLFGGFRDFEGMPLWYRQPDLYSNVSPYGFTALFGNLQSAYAQGELAGVIADNFSYALMGRIQSWNASGGLRPFHLPYFEGSVDLSYRWGEKIDLEARLQLLGPRQAFDQTENPALPAILRGYADLFFKAEYLYNSRISAFLSLSNLLNAQYDLYLSYPAQNVNLLMGLGYRF